MYEVHGSRESMVKMSVFENWSIDSTQFKLKSNRFLFQGSWQTNPEVYMEEWRAKNS